MKQITLLAGKEKSALNFHPWIFSGAIAKKEQGIADGDWVAVYTSAQKLVGTGLYNNGSIAVRLLTFRELPQANFWQEKFEKALQLRHLLNLAGSEQTNAYRLIHGEGDGLPGLIIDIYNNTAVMQCHNLGMYMHRNEISEALQLALGKNLESIYDKSSETMPKIPGHEFENTSLYGHAQQATIAKENGISFSVNWEKGQKTGFFLDQRENRQMLANFAQGKSVLNTFCYSGGFSVYALMAGAALVHSVDSSKKAIELTDENVRLNGNAEKHKSFAMDTFDFFKQYPDPYDIIILDPPAFAKNIKALNNATRGYQRLNKEGLQRVKPGGLLFTFSCSQAVSKDLFRKVVFAAAAETGRKVRILQQLSQPADHPINIYHPEGEYLKGLLLYVE